MYPVRRAPPTMASIRADDFSPRQRLDRRQLRRVARRHAGQPILGVLWRQFRAEWRLRRAGRSFRQHRNDLACEAYVEMHAETFADINARQAWANWRTIPASLDGRLPERPLRAIDCCCGAGDSTAVVVWCCPPGSRVLGIDIGPQLVERARGRVYEDHLGDPAAVTFHCQNVLEPWHDEQGVRIADGSVDLVNASGAVGCHFSPEQGAWLAGECARTLRPGGLATIDAGPDGTAPDELIRIFRRAGFRYDGHSRCCLFDRFRHLRFVRCEGDAAD